MCKYILTSALDAGLTQNDALTRYWAVAGQLTANATEANVELPVRDAGTFSNLSIYISATAVTEEDTDTATVRKSTADTALTVSWDARTTGTFTDDAHTVSFAATDEIDLKIVTPAHAGTVAITVQTIAITFESSTSGRSTSFLHGRVSGAVTIESGTTFNIPTGRLTNYEGTESNTAVPLQAAFTGGGLACNIFTNSRTTTTTLRSRKNSGNGNCIITIDASETGQLEDDTPGTTDSFAAGDTFDLGLTTGTGTESMSFNSMSYMLLSTAGYVQYISAYNGSGTASGTVYHSIGGGNHPVPSSTEANCAVLSPFDFTAKELQAYVGDQGGGSDAVTLRDNLGDSTLTVDITSTGLKRDSTHEVSITGGSDEIDLCATRSAALRVNWMSFLGYVASGATPLTGTGTSALGSYAGSTVAARETYAAPLTDDLNAVW